MAPLRELAAADCRGMGAFDPVHGADSAGVLNFFDARKILLP
jgi:hypothetical protein